MCNLLSVLLISLDPIFSLCVALFAFQTVTALLISLMSHVEELITCILSLAELKKKSFALKMVEEDKLKV